MKTFEDSAEPKLSPGEWFVNSNSDWKKFQYLPMLSVCKDFLYHALENNQESCIY